MYPNSSDKFQFEYLDNHTTSSNDYSAALSDAILSGTQTKLMMALRMIFSTTGFGQVV